MTSSYPDTHSDTFPPTPPASDVKSQISASSSLSINNTPMSPDNNTIDSNRNYQRQQQHQIGNASSMSTTTAPAAASPSDLSQESSNSPQIMQPQKRSSIISNILPSAMANPTPKSAYASQNKQLSMQLHQQKASKRKPSGGEEDLQHHTEKHAGLGDIIKSVVFGGLDGIITTFAVVAACVGSKLSYATVLIVGFSNLIGDGFAMGLGDFFSSRAEAFHARKLFKQYLWRVEKKPVEAQRVMKTVFLKKGFSESESQRIVEYLGHNKEAFADIMLLELDGVCVEESSIWGPLKGGLVTFISFLIFGAVPLIPFVVKGNFQEASDVLNWHFYVSCGLTAASLFLLGTVKNALLSKNWLYGGMFMLIQGGISTLIAYFIGFAIERFLLPYV